MKPIKPIDRKSIIIRFCLSEKDHKILFGLYKQSTCRTLSEYIRSVISQKPVQIRYRNASLDETLEELTDLRMKLKSVLQHMQERREELTSGENSEWSSGDSDIIIKQELHPLIARIFERISNFSDIWSQYSRVRKA